MIGHDITFNEGLADMFRIGIIQRSIQDEPLADWEIAIVVRTVQWSDAIVIRSCNVSHRTYFEEPLTQRQMASEGSDEHGRPAVISSAAPTSSIHLHSARCPSWQAIHIGVTPRLSPLMMSLTAPTSNNHLQIGKWPSAQAQSLGGRCARVLAVLALDSPIYRA